MDKENWYVLRTYKDQEYEAASLVDTAVSKSLYSLCRVPKKLKVFRNRGEFRLVEEIMFPGYLFIKTKRPKELCEELKKSRELPRFLPFGRDDKGEEVLIPVSSVDLDFLHLRLQKRKNRRAASILMKISDRFLATLKKF